MGDRTLIYLSEISKSDINLVDRMNKHYSKPQGFVGRTICYAIYYYKTDEKLPSYCGNIVAGSATKNLPGRHEFLKTDKFKLNNIINNIFYSINKIETKYPCRNFTSRVITEFIRRSAVDWEIKYGDNVLGFETLVELPRSGDCYKKAGFTEVGITKGYTCKRTSGESTDSWSGRRVWDKNNLRPKRVLCYKINV